jgi:Flp pilus assembly pilin Flp
MGIGFRHALAEWGSRMTAVQGKPPAEGFGMRPKLANFDERNIKMKNIMMRLWKEEEGQDLLEYALLIVLIVLVAAAAINPLGSTIGTVYTNANTCLTTQKGC